MKVCRRCGHMFFGPAGVKLCHRCRPSEQPFPPEPPDLDAELQWR